MALQRRTPKLAAPLRRLLLSQTGPGGMREATSPSHRSSQTGPVPRFGIAFDIDGVLIRGGKPIGGTPRALRQLYDKPTENPRLRVPYIFFTNGGGTTESARAIELSRQLDVPVFPNQVTGGASEKFSKVVVGMGCHISTRRVLGSIYGVGSGPLNKSYSSAASERTQISVDGTQLDSLQPGVTESSVAESVAASLPHGDALREVVVATADSSVPTAFVQYVIDGVHVSTGLPWWASIVATTVAIRFLVLPIMIYQMKATARLTLLRPELEKLTNRIKESNYDPKVVEDNQVRMKALFVRHKTTPFSPILGAFVQAPIFMCFFFGIRNMAEKMDSFKEGGIWWFTDLSTPDSLFIMPVLSGAFFLLTVELGAADGMQGQPMLAKMKNFMRGLAVLLVPLTASFPKAMFCYWLTANVFSLVQAAVLKQPGVKSVLGIPDVSHLAKPGDIPVEPILTYSQPPKLKGETRAKRWKS